MKILIVSKFLYNRGGAEIYALNLAKILESFGHEICFYAMKYDKNINVPEDKYFAEEIFVSTNNLYKKIKSVPRLFGVGVKDSFEKLLEDFSPDIVHLNNIHSYISPIVGEIAHKHRIPVVWTIHDLKLICPIYSGTRNGSLCSLCRDNVFNVVRHKCMKNSFLQSFVAYFEAKYWSKERLMDFTDMFISPSDFLRDEYIRNGFLSEKIRTVYHSIPRKISDIVKEYRYNEYCYVGRLSHEKGLETLINVACTLPYKLRIIGDGPLRDKLEKMANKNDNIIFEGYKDWDELKDILGNAKFIVVPSEWHEVFGLVSIEAQALGTPVLAANIGGLPETVKPGKTGLLFESGNKEDLKGAIEKMFNTNFYYKEISELTRTEFSSLRHYENLMEIYKSVIKNHAE